MAREERFQLLICYDRSHSRPATAMRNTERFMQVQVTYVRTNQSRRGPANLCIQIGAIQVDKAAMLMNQITDLFDIFFIDSVGGAISDLHTPTAFTALFLILTYIFYFDISVIVIPGNADLDSRHYGAGGVGAMSRGWNDCDVALVVTVGMVVRPDGHQARILPLWPGVGLKGRFGEACDFSEPGAQFIEEFVIPFCLISRYEGVYLTKFRPGQRNHLRCGIQFHGTGSQ